jgi:hypothetical protein
MGAGGVAGAREQRGHHTRTRRRQRAQRAGEGGEDKKSSRADRRGQGWQPVRRQFLACGSDRCRGWRSRRRRAPRHPRLRGPRAICASASRALSVRRGTPGPRGRARAHGRTMDRACTVPSSGRGQARLTRAPKPPPHPAWSARALPACGHGCSGGRRNSVRERRGGSTALRSSHGGAHPAGVAHAAAVPYVCALPGLTSATARPL